MLEADLDLLIRAARAAGEIACPLFESGAKVWDKPDGAGPVTEADLAVNDMLHDTLRSARPGYGWLSEETQDSPERLDHETLFIIDPIDGTRSFTNGDRTWSHSLAVVRGGEVVAGVVYLPLRDLLFAAAKGIGAHLNGAPLSVRDGAALDAAQVLATKPNMDPAHWTGAEAPGFTRHHRPSLAYRLALIAQGRFDAMLTLRPSWEWDIAAGAVIVSEAGGQMRDKVGAPLKFNNPDPRLNGVIAAGPQMQAQLQNRLARAAQ